MLKINIDWSVKQVSENFIQQVIAAGNGDTDAMAKLYSKTLKNSYFLADLLCAGDGSAAEITKKAYAKAFCSIDKLKKPEAFEIWMKQNIALIYKESQKFVFGDAETGISESASDFLPESVLTSRDLCVKILDAVASLKPVLRTAVVLHYNNGMPVSALAKFLGVSDSTASALLGKARAEILAFCDFESVSEPSKSLPVLTRIFQFKTEDISINGSDVRDIFIFALEAYEASKAPAIISEDATPAKSEEETGNKAAEEKEEEIKKENDDKSTVELIKSPFVIEEKATDDKPAFEESNVISLKQKIDEILDGEKASENEISESESEDNQHELSMDEIDIPVFNVSDMVPSVSEETLNNFAEEKKPEKATSKKKPKIKIDTKINPRILAVIGAVLVLVVIIVVAVAGGSDDKPNVEESTNAAENIITTEANIPASADTFVFRSGGFEECEEITYFNEYSCYFKSKTTGKYGLMDYQGNVILQPYYDGFDRCTNTVRDYTGAGSYHSLVKHGSESYELTFKDGLVTISQTAHSAHTIETQKLEGVAYDERDRYFEGYAAARKGDKWGYVSQENDKKVIKYEYDAVNDLQLGDSASCDYCRPVTGGYIAVKKDGMMGIINLKNKEIVPFEYSNIMPGKDGVFIGCRNGVWGVILLDEAVNTFKGVEINIVEQQPSSTDVPVSENAEDTTIGKFKVVSDDGANIRTDAGSDYKKVGELEYGDEVVGYATKEAENGNDWLCIKHDGEFAWVAMSTLEKVN